MNRDLKKCMLNIVGKFEASDDDEADLDFFSKQIFYAKLLNNNLNKNQKAHIKNHVYKKPKPLNSENSKNTLLLYIASFVFLETDLSWLNVYKNKFN